MMPADDPGRARGRADSEVRSELLDDVDDREELRKRYEMLLQELRVTLPGVQVLSAFLLTAPFSRRFADLDTWGRRAYGVALTASMVSVVSMLAPTLLHRIGPRTARSDRLTWSVRLLLLGVTSLGVALISALWGVVRFVFGTPTAWYVTTPLFVLLAVLWFVIPSLLRPHRTNER